MKAAVVSAPGKLELMEIPMPRPGPYDCLVKIDACAVCTGTDSAVAFGSFSSCAEHPFVLGHESTGLIVEVGPQVRNFQVGQRVTRPGGVLAGERVDGIGSSWGGYAEYGLVRDTAVADAAGVPSHHLLASSRSVIPADVDPVSAALSVNQREIVSVTARMALGPGTRVLVIGSGYNGLLYALLCKHYGAERVAMLGSAWLEERACTRFGADGYVDYRDPQAAERVRAVLGGPPTHIIDAVGSKSSLAMAESLLTPGAALGVYGLDDVTLTGDTRARLARDYPVIDTATDEAAVVDAWYALWRQGFFANPYMVDLLLPLEGIHEAFATLDRREAVKIVLEI